MKIIIEKNSKYVLRFDKGEEMIDGLVKFCEENKIAAGWFFGIGATQEIILSYYNLAEKKYYDKEFKESREIISLLGNVAKMKDKIIIHTHGSFSDPEMQVASGHIKKLIVGPTCEIILEKLDGKIEREFSDEVGLNLMK